MLFLLRISSETNYRKEKSLKNKLLKIWNVICLIPPIGCFVGLVVGCLIYSIEAEYMCFYALGYGLVGVFLHWIFLYMPRIRHGYSMKHGRKVGYGEILNGTIQS